MDNDRDKGRRQGDEGAFKRLSARVSGMKPVMQVIGEMLKASIDRNFEAGGRPGWQPLAKPKGKTLIDTARLLGSINSKASKDRAEVGTNAVYDAIRHFGFKGTVSVRPHRRKVNTRYIKRVGG